MSKPILYFDRLNFTNDINIDLSGQGVIVLVGPNNVGKTTALRELQAYLNEGRLVHNQREKSIFSSVTLSRAEKPKFDKWLEAHKDLDPPEPIRQPNLRRYRNWSTQMNIDPEQAYARFISGPSFAEIYPFVAASSIQGFLEGEIPDIYADGQTTNKQFEQFYYDEKLEAELSELSQTAFQNPVSLSRTGKKSVLHYGRIPDLSERPTSEERSKLKSFPKVSEQGEGVRTLILLAQSMILGNEPIVFLDEPEAHLHPPQAKLAGKYVSERGKRSQVFVATHSVDFILGMLSNNVPVTIVRLDRSPSNELRVATLKGRDLQKAWSDPIIRYSRALSGLMHRGVVICESDGDCLYYEVVLDYLRDKDHQSAHDLLFIHAGGKAGAKKVIPSLKSLAVPICVITDFDALRDWTEIKALYEQVGGNSEDIRSDWLIVDNYLRSVGETRKIKDLQQEINGYFDQSKPNELFSKTENKKIQEFIKVKNGWDEAKKYGLNSLKSEPNKAAKRLLEKLGKNGILVCPLGELEAFHPEAPSVHGPQWVMHVIEEKLFENIGAEPAEFIKSIPSHCKL